MKSLFYLNPKFQASSHLLWLYSPVCVGPGRKPRRPVFSERGSFIFGHVIHYPQPVAKAITVVILALTGLSYTDDKFIDRGGPNHKKICLSGFLTKSESADFLSNEGYRNGHKFSDRFIWANSANPNQTAPRGAV